MRNPFRNVSRGLAGLERAKTQDKVNREFAQSISSDKGRIKPMLEMMPNLNLKAWYRKKYGRKGESREQMIKKLLVDLGGIDETTSDPT